MIHLVFYSMTPTMVVFLLTFIFLATSTATKFFPAKKPNNFYGLRTEKTLSSPEKWEQGNKLFGDLLFKFCLGNAFLVMLLFHSFGPSSFVILFTAFSFSFFMILAVVITERKL